MRLVRMLLAPAAALCLLGCDPSPSGEPRGAPSGGPSVSPPMPSSSSAEARPSEDEMLALAARRARELQQRARDLGPVDAKTLTERLGTAASVRIWEYEPAPSGGAPRMAAVVLREPAQVKAVLAAVGGAQKPERSEDCKPCEAPRHFVFEDRRGLHLGAVELGCVDEGAARFRMPASDVCGNVKLADAAGLQKVWTDARARPASQPAGLRGAPAEGPAMLP